MKNFFFEKYAEQTQTKDELLLIYSHELQTNILDQSKLSAETVITEVNGEITDTDDILIASCVTEMTKSNGESTDDDDIFYFADATGTRESGEALDDDDFLIN